MLVVGQTPASPTTFLGGALARRRYQALAYKSLFTATSGSRPCILSVMAGEVQLSKLGSDDVDRLRAFHAAHFPGQHTPDLHVSAESQEPEVEGDEDGLGYYADGSKRTLSDEQIKMFRHSEIHRLLSDRRQRQQQEEDRGPRHISADDQDRRRRRFDDEVPQEQEQVDTLMYDEQPSTEASTVSDQPKKFVWHQLRP